MQVNPAVIKQCECRQSEGFPVVYTERNIHQNRPGNPETDRAATVSPSRLIILLLIVFYVSKLHYALSLSETVRRTLVVRKV